MKLLWNISVIACLLVVFAAGKLTAYNPSDRTCDCEKIDGIEDEVPSESEFNPHVECHKDMFTVNEEMFTDGNEEEIVEDDTVEEDILIEDVVEEVEEIEQPELKKSKKMNDKLQAPQKVVKQKYKNVDESIETIEQLVDSTIEESSKPLDVKKGSKSPKDNKLKIKSGKSEKKVQKPKKSTEKPVENKKTSKSSDKNMKNSADTNKKNKQKDTKTNEKSKKSNKSKKSKSKKNEL